MKYDITFETSAVTLVNRLHILVREYHEAKYQYNQTLHWILRKWFVNNDLVITKSKKTITFHRDKITEYKKIILHIQSNMRERFKENDILITIPISLIYYLQEHEKLLEIGK